jgi:hypothetical protein
MYSYKTRYVFWRMQVTPMQTQFVPWCQKARISHMQLLQLDNLTVCMFHYTLNLLLWLKLLPLPVFFLQYLFWFPQLPQFRSCGTVPQTLNISALIKLKDRHTDRQTDMTTSVCIPFLQITHKNSKNKLLDRHNKLNKYVTTLLWHTYLLTYSLHGAESFLRS